MKSPINLRQIETFRAVMICGSISGAANLMNVTQPGVSRTVAMLEGRLGYSLFTRRGRRIVPTAEAEALYREVEKSYRSIEYIGQIALDIGMQRAGALRIATLPALAQWLIPHAISRFLSSRPKVTVFLDSMPSRQIGELVSTRQFDLGVVELPIARPAISVEPLQPVPYMAVIPASHPLAAEPLISLTQLDGERMILVSHHSFMRHQINNMFSSLGVAPDVVIETPSSSIACALASAGAGITLVGRWTARPFESAQVVLRPLKEKFDSSFAIIFPDAGERLSLANSFADEFRILLEQE